MITFTKPDNTRPYPPGATVTFAGTLGPPIRCSLVQPPPGPDIPVPLPLGLTANWAFDVTLPTAPGTHTYEVEAAGSKEAVRTLIVVEPVVLPGPTPGAE